MNDITNVYQKSPGNELETYVVQVTSLKGCKANIR